MAIKILVVEDDVDIAKLLINFLAKSGFKAKSANCAEAAEVILKNNEIDLVLTDIKLPDTDGIKLTKNIKKKYVKNMQSISIVKRFSNMLVVFQVYIANQKLN